MFDLARTLSGIPGRKNLIWFSGAFPISILPDPESKDPFGAVVSAEQEFRETVNLLTLSQVSVYPIDTRGVLTSHVLDPTNANNQYTRNPKLYAAEESSFFTQSSNDVAP